MRDRVGHWTNDVVPWCNCCRDKIGDSYCANYYYRRPSRSWNAYFPPAIGLEWGDPHIRTLDNHTYTFNGIGEFWLIKQNNTFEGREFYVQARMKYYQNSNSNSTTLNASIFSCFAIRSVVGDYKGKVLQVELTESGGIAVLLDGDRYPLGTALNQSQFEENFVIQVEEESTGYKVNVVYFTGFSFSFSVFEGALVITAGVNEQHRSTLTGLMGNFNGIKDDDLMTPDGNVIPITSNLHDIHYQFGLKWKITKEESLFTYPEGLSYIDFQDESFTPSFYQPKPEDVSFDVQEMCGASQECLFDYVNTGGNKEFANNTVKTEKKIEEQKKELDTRVIVCPPLNFSKNLMPSFSNSYFPGSIVTFTCSGFAYLNGLHLIECVNDSWSGQLPYCVMIENNTDPLSTTSNHETITSITPIQPNEDFAIYRPPNLYYLIGGSVAGFAVLVGAMGEILYYIKVRAANA